MNSAFFSLIDKSNAGTNCRNSIKQMVLDDSSLLTDLVAIATDISIKNHYKAVWIVEMLAETDSELLASFIDVILNTVKEHKHQSAIRGISRTIYYLEKSKSILLTALQEEKIIEYALDGLIGDYKVAPKVYNMYTLGNLSSNYIWLKEELKSIIDNDYSIQSPAYKAASREVLKKIKK